LRTLGAGIGLNRANDGGMGRNVALLVVAGCLLRLVLAACIPLTPQEAYYWTWTQFPDWSYFDHPPLASYGIAFSTAVMGQTAFAIKLAAVGWSLGWNILWARLAQDMFGDRRVTFWSLAALNLSLLYVVYGVGATPDGPLLFGWIGTIWALWRADRPENGRWWYAAGFFAGVALLGKYSGILLVPVVGLFLLAVPQRRHWLRRRQPYLAALIAGLIFSPVVIWNAQHDWVSLAFQSSRRLNEMGVLKPRFVGLLLATQCLLLTPYLFGMSVAAGWRSARDWMLLRTRVEPRVLLLLLSAAVPLVVFGAASFRTNSKVNWLMPAWWSLVILGMHFTNASKDGGRRRVWGLSTSALLLLAAIVLAAIPNLPLPGDLNIWSGWRGAAQHVDRVVAAERAAGRQAFVFSPNYKNSSLIWFHRPSQERTYAQDIVGRRALQFDYFPHTEELKGATGFLVVSNQAQSALDLESVRPLFQSLERVAVLEVGAMGRSTRSIEIWKGAAYRGRPAEPAVHGDDASPE